MSIVSKAVLLVSLGLFSVYGNAQAQNTPAQKPAVTNPSKPVANPSSVPNTGVKSTPAVQKSAAPKAETGKFQMQMYQMVFLKTGPNRNQDSATAAGLQAGHMANISRLAKEGKIVLAGPFGDKGDLRGIFIMDVPSAEEAKKLCDSDPAIIAGRLSVEIKPWYGPKGLTYTGKEEALSH